MNCYCGEIHYLCHSDCFLQGTHPIGHPPHSWDALLRQGFFSLNHLQNHRGVIWAIIIWLGFIYGDLPMLLVLGFYCCPARTRWGFKWGVLTWFIWGAWCGFTAILGVSWGISAWGWSPVWCVMVVTRSAGVMVSWSAPVVASVMWSGATPVWVIMAVTSASVRVQLWSWPAILIPVPVMVPRSRSGVMPCAWEWCLLWHTGVPDGGILSGQSADICQYSLHSIIVYLDNYGQCGLSLGTGNIGLPH